MHVCTIECHANVEAWLLAWGRAIRIHEADASARRYSAAVRRFDAVVKRHRAICPPSRTVHCAIRCEGGAYHYAGLIDEPARTERRAHHG